MGCDRGAASPDRHTTLRLFADSGGHCQNPSCVLPLFEDVGNRNLHLAEMAHIFAASDSGPRARPKMSSRKRGAYENLLLLCGVCHTRIDKAPEAFPDSMVRTWKLEHKARIDELFGVVLYPSRGDARAAAERLLSENLSIFEAYGPESEDAWNPESELANLWKRNVLARILPNNRRLLRIIDTNRQHLTGHETATAERFRLHVRDFEAKHLGPPNTPSGSRFPFEMNKLFLDPT